MEFVYSVPGSEQLGEEYRRFAWHQFYEFQPRVRARYEFYPDRIIAHDPRWGTEVIGDEPGDEVFLKLADNDLVKRARAIEQLVLDVTTATIPDTANFSRWEHMWGGVVLVRKLTKGQGYSDRERLRLQLKVFVHDLGQTAFSHLGDWMFQDDTSEDQHDKELLGLLDVSGVSDILREAGFTPEEIVTHDEHDGLDRPLPDLSDDRLDYGAREMLRWLPVNEGLLSEENFTIKNGQIVAKSIETARLFAKGYLLLTTEHWNEPVHRLQLVLQEQLVKHLLTNGKSGFMATYMCPPDMHHPRDYMYTIDNDIMSEVQQRDVFTQLLYPLMQQIGLHKRKDFVANRYRCLTQWLQSDTDRYPNPLEHMDGLGEHTNLPLPPQVSMIPVKNHSGIKDFGNKPYTVDFYLRPLKMRVVDPLFIDEIGELKRLSAVDANYRNLKQQQMQLMGQAYVARLHVNPEAKQVLEAGMADAKERWAAALQRPRMTPEQFRNMLHDAVGATVLTNMIDVEWYR